MFSGISYSNTNPIVPGKETKFSLIYSPQSEGTKTARINIRSNDPKSPDYRFFISGTAIKKTHIERGTPPPQLPPPVLIEVIITAPDGYTICVNGIPYGSRLITINIEKGPITLDLKDQDGRDVPINNPKRQVTPDTFLFHITF